MKSGAGLRMSKWTSLVMACCGIITADIETIYSASASCDKAHFRVVLDVGHTPLESGAVSARGRTEYEFNHHLASVIKAHLISAGFTDIVVLLSPSETGLVRRIQAANALLPMIFISVHHDSVQKQYLDHWVYEGRDLFFSNRFKGWSLFVSMKNQRASESLQLARSIGRYLLDIGLPFSEHHAEHIRGEGRYFLDKKLGIYDYDNLVVLKLSEAPAVLIEAGIIVNRDEELALQSTTRQAEISNGILSGINDFCEKFSQLR